MRRFVGVAFQGARRHGDRRKGGALPLARVVARLAFGQPKPPAVIVNRDCDMIGIVERRRRAREGGIVERPAGGGRPPDQPREIAGVGGIAGAAALGGEIELIPPAALRLRGEGARVRGLAADQIAADRDEPPDPFGRKHGQDAGGAGAPVAPADEDILEPQRLDQVERVDGKRRLLPVARRGAGQEAGVAISAQIGDDHPIARLRQDRRDIGIAVDVIGPAVEQQHGRAVVRTRLGIGDVEQVGAHMAHRREAAQRGGRCGSGPAGGSGRGDECRRRTRQGGGEKRAARKCGIGHHRVPRRQGSRDQQQLAGGGAVPQIGMRIRCG